MDDPLLEFFRLAKEQGAADQTVIDLLKHRGWPERQIYAAVQAHYEERCGLKLPARQSSWEAARDAFVYLLSFIALCAWVWSMGSLWFTMINLWFPDPLDRYSSTAFRYNLASALSGLIVGLPVYVACLRVLSREVAAHPDKLDSGTRRWLIYMAMLIAAGVILGDLINFLTELLRGALTPRFVSKSLTVLALAGGVLWYHLGSVGRIAAPDVLNRRDRIYVGAVIAAAILAVGLGFLRLGSPATARLYQADVRRSEDLQRIAQAVHEQWRATKQLPAALSSISTLQDVADPITKKPYEYRTLSDVGYELCADFATEQREEPEHLGMFARHGVGRTCLSLNAVSWPN